MAGLPSPFELDEAWLRARGVTLDDDQVDAFVERVGIKMAQGITESEARRQALEEIQRP